MSTNTSKLGLVKPATTELYDVAIPNANMDKIDAGYDDSITTKTAGGTATAITLTAASITAYAAGQTLSFIASGNNGAAATTVKVGSLAALPLYKQGGALAPTLISGKAYTIYVGSGATSFFLKASAEGSALVTDVLAGTTFSNDVDTGLSGTMIDRGTVNITPGTTNQTIAAGKHSGSGVVYGDADLVSANIKSGANIFGVAGNVNVVDTSTGDATAANILNAKKAYVAGALVTGTMPIKNGDNASVGSSVVSTTLKLTAPAGYYDGNDNVTITDADFVAANIKAGVDVLGVTGTLVPVTGSGLTKSGIAKENIAVGDFVEYYKGGVRKAFRSKLRAIGGASELYANYNSQYDRKTIEIGTNKYLTVYCNSGGYYEGVAWTQNDDGSVTKGAAAQLDTYLNYQDNFDLHNAGTDKAVLFTRPDIWGDVQGIVINVSTLTITTGTRQASTLGVLQTLSVKACKLTDTKFIVYYYAISGSTGKLVVATISGNTISYGTPLTIADAQYGRIATQHGMFATSTSRFIVCVNNARDVYVKIFTESGGTITAGTATTLTSLLQTNIYAWWHIVFTKHSATQYAVTVLDSATNVNSITLHVGTFTENAGTITAGTNIREDLIAEFDVSGALIPYGTSVAMQALEAIAPSDTDLIVAIPIYTNSGDTSQTFRQMQKRYSVSNSAITNDPNGWYSDAFPTCSKLYLQKLDSGNFFAHCSTVTRMNAMLYGVSKIAEGFANATVSSGNSATYTLI